MGKAASKNKKGKTGAKKSAGAKILKTRPPGETETRKFGWEKKRHRVTPCYTHDP